MVKTTGNLFFQCACESWHLTESLVKQLVSFQAEMGRNVSQLRALEAINLGTRSPSMHEGTHFGQKADFFLQRTALGESDSMSTQ